MDQFMTPRNMGLMGLAAGLLQSSGASPREITLGEAMGNGMQQGMQGIQQGMGLQMQQQHMEALKSRAEMARHKLEQEMAMKDLYRNTVQNAGTDDPVAVGRRLMNSGEMGLAKIGMDMMKSKQVKQFMKGMDGNGAPTYYAGYNTGELSTTGVTPAEKAMQINTGGQVHMVDPYARGSMGMTMAPGESARLAQSQNQFDQSHMLDLIKTRQSMSQARQPQFKDGYWVTPPTQDNPEGSIIATDLATSPKGSPMEKRTASERTKNVLGDDTEELIRKATGSGLGSIVDSAAGFLGTTNSGSRAAGTLKMRAASLAGNVPRFEGPQSDADRQYYMEMVGNLGDASIPSEIKMQSLKELKRIHGLVENGTVKGSAMPSGSSGDGWGELR